MQRKRRYRKGGSHSTISLLRKELREGNLQSLLGGSSCVVSSSNTAADPLLSSFIYNLPFGEESESTHSHSSAEARSARKNSEETLVDRSVQSLPPLSDKEQEEKTRRCEFVQGMLMSMMLDDDL
ncbi:hypothetical protein NE237_011741 [Protea cynaroides]|uniref:Di19 C-terminal domain-containing protein n=1 Tax=Protea cynaroides TaxID=273540 RepID=A0A9Q0GW72_9MAGN|nr:hypothetical protein NE237_011741 [Protea cynaroides]